MKKQTAVDWLMENLHTAKDPFKQAKEMEKQQIIDAREDGIIVGIRITNNTYYSSFKEAEQYYNETYGTKG